MIANVRKSNQLKKKDAFYIFIIRIVFSKNKLLKKCKLLEEKKNAEICIFPFRLNIVFQNMLKNSM